MSKIVKNILRLIIFFVLLVISFNSKVFAVTILPGNSSYTTSGGTTYYYDRDSSNDISEFDFALFAGEGAGRFVGAPIGDLAGKFTYVHNASDRSTDTRRTLNQPYAFCAGHGNTNLSSTTDYGDYLYKICTILDIYPDKIIARGNGRVGAEAVTNNSVDVENFATTIQTKGNNAEYIKALSALAKYTYDHAQEANTEQPDVVKLLNYYKDDLVENKLLDHSINLTTGYTQTSDNALLNKTTSDGSTTYLNYANNVKDHKFNNKTSVSNNADRKEGTYNGTKYDYWGPFQITRSDDIATITVTTANAGAYKGIANIIGGQPKVASTSNIKSNNSFYVVTTRTTSTAQATITIKTESKKEYYTARLMFFKHSLKTTDGQNIIVWRAYNTSISDTVTIKVTPSPTTGDLEITKYNSNKSEKLAGAKFQLYNSNGNIVHYTGVTGASTTYTYTPLMSTNTVIIIPSTGTTTIKNLPAGSYTLKEIKAPTGYVAKATNTNVTITSGATKKVDVTNEKLGSLEITKVDSSNNNTKLAGAQFELYKGNTKLGFSSTVPINGAYTYSPLSNVNDTITIPASGTVTIKNLPAGTDYKLKEIYAPTGYKLDSSNIAITITNNNTTKKTVTNEKIKGSLQIFKYDKRVGITKPLAGGKFILNTNVGSFIAVTKLSTGKYKYAGLCSISDATTNALVTDNNGKINITDIPKYINGTEVKVYIIETQAPAGYERYTDELYKMIEADSTVTANVPEPPEPIDLKILKKSTTHPNEKYAGVGFKVICTGDTSSNVLKGWIKANSNKEWNGSYYSFLNATTFYTDSNGEVTVKGLPRNCKYEVYEVDLGDHPEFEPLPMIEISCYGSADGSTDSLYSNRAYAKKTNKVPTNAANSHATYTVSASNTENPGKLKIQKIDTSGKNRVSGIGFRVQDAELNWLKFDTTTGKYLGKTRYYYKSTLLTTDNTGYTIQLNTIPIGTYHIYETDLGDYSSIYELEDELSVIKTITSRETIKVKDCGTKTITSSSSTVTVTARNTPVEGSAQIQKIDTSGKGRVGGIGFKIINTETNEWLIFSSGKYVGKSTVYPAGTILRTDSTTGLTEEVNSIPKGTYRVYEVDLGSYNDIYSLTEDLRVTSTNPADNGYTNIKVKDCGTFTITEDNMTTVKSVKARNTPDEKDGSIRIKKIDTSTGNTVSGIGFKIFNYATKEWLTCDETTGEYEDTVEDIEDATELTTGSTGYTIKVTDVPPGNYLVFETNLGSHTEYPALETVSIVGKNNSTITFAGKQIESEETHSQYHAIKADEETNLEIVAENTSTPTPENIVIRKTDKGTGNVVSGIGFKIYDEINKKWLQIDTSTGDITGNTTDFEAATELVTGSNGYTVEVKEIPEGKYSVYETSLGTNINTYKLGTVTVKDDGVDTEKTGKLVQTGNIGKTGKTITVKAVNEQLGKMQIRKVDTSDGEKIVEGVGFKILNYITRKWLQIDTTTGKVTGTTDSFEEATTLYTQSNGYTVEISDIPLDGDMNIRGVYVVYETDLGDNYEYELGNVTVPDNGTTKTVTGKSVKGVQLKNTGTLVTVTAENTPITRIKLSGYVWKNGLNHGKTSTMDNVYDPNLAKDVKLRDWTVILQDYNGKEIQRTQTDENGRYEFDGINVDELSDYRVLIPYDGIKYQVLNNKSNGTNTNKFTELIRNAYNQIYSTIKNDNRLTYIKEPHASYLNGDISINAVTDYLATSDGVVGTKTTGEAIANIAQIKSQGIKEITNINLGVYERTLPDLEVREYMYQLVSTDKEDTDVDEENTWKLNRMHINSEILGKSDYSVSIWDGINNKVLTKTGNEAKKMYATYKIALVNASTGVNNKINKVTSYMDKDYSFVKAEIADSKHSNATAIANDKITVTNGKITLDNLDLDIKSQKTAYLYIEVEIPIDKLTQKLTAGGDTALTKNYTEISSYTSYVGEDTPYAGVDKDSAPGNMNVELYDSTYEDDEGCSPNIWIIAKLNRSASASAASTDFIDKLISAKFSE